MPPTPTVLLDPRETRRPPRRRGAPPSPPTSRTSSVSSTSTAAATRRPASTRSAAGRRSVCEPSARAVTSHPNDQGLGDTVVAELAGLGPARPGRSCCIGHMDTVFDPGHRRGAPVRDRGRHRHRPGRHGHEERPARRAVRHRGAARRSSAACRSSGSCSSPTRTRRSARRCRRRTSGDSPRTRTRASSSSAPARTATSCPRRKGILDLGITVNGRAAHAGVEPEKGRSAILEARPDRDASCTRSTAAGRA